MVSLAIVVVAGVELESCCCDRSEFVQSALAETMTWFESLPANEWITNAD